MRSRHGRKARSGRCAGGLIAPSARPRPALISLPNPSIPCKRFTSPPAARRRLSARATSAPWDIIEVNNMAPQRFEVLKPVPSVPTMTITAQGDYVEGDVAVFLKDLPY